MKCVWLDQMTEVGRIVETVYFKPAMLPEEGQSMIPKVTSHVCELQRSNGVRPHPPGIGQHVCHPNDPSVSFDYAETGADWLNSYMFSNLNNKPNQ